MQAPHGLLRATRALLLTLIGVVGIISISASGAVAAPVNHLVISQIQTIGSGPSGIADEYIELYNSTSQPVNLAGWSIQYKIVGITYTGLISQPLSGTIPAYGYYLLRPIGAVGTSDATYAGFTLDEAGGNVFLVGATTPITTATDATIVDRVGYGPLADAPEGSPATAPALGQSIERLPGQSYLEGNGTDTNNNAADFIVRTALLPRLTTSTIQVPTAPVITNITPGADTILNSQNQTISATITDGGGAGVPASAISLTIDNGAISATSYSETTGAFSAAVSLSQGTHTARITANDRAGNGSTVTWNFTIDTIAPTLALEVNHTAPKTNVHSVVLSLVGKDGPQGVASGVGSMRIAMDGTLDTEAWEPFSDTVTRDLPSGEGIRTVQAEVRDRSGNVSTVASASIIVETTAVLAPTQGISSTTGRTITLTWNVVPRMASYIVRYTDGTTLYGPLPTTATSLKIDNLDLNKVYRFEIAAVSPAGAVSSFVPVVGVGTRGIPTTAGGAPAPVGTAPVVALPKTAATTETAQSPAPAAAAATTAIATATTTVEPAATPAAPEGRTPSSSPTPTPAATVSPSPSPTASPAIKGGEDNQPRDWTRIIVALSILIIAAGVATGGWYLYQWWTTRPGDKPKGKGRW